MRQLLTSFLVLVSLNLFAASSANIYPFIGPGNGSALFLVNGEATPEQFGARGDGVTDDTTAFANAMIYCMTNFGGGSAPGFYPKLKVSKQYFIGGTLPPVTNGFTMEGLHSWTMIPVYAQWNTNSCITFGTTNGLVRQPVNINALVGLHIKGITFVGPGVVVNSLTNSFAISLASGNVVGSDQNILIEDCNFINFGHGIIWSNVAASTVSRCWFDFCQFAFEQYGIQSINNILNQLNAADGTIGVIVPDGHLTMVSCGISGNGNFGTFKAGSGVVTYDPVSLRMGGPRLTIIGCAFESTKPYMIDLRGGGQGDITLIGCEITPPANNVGILLSNSIVRLQNNVLTGDGAGNQLVTQDAVPQIFPDIRSQIIVSNYTSGGVTTGWPQDIRNGMFIQGFFSAVSPFVPGQSRVVLTSLGDQQATLNLPVGNNPQFGYYINSSIIGGSGNFGLTIGEINSGTPDTKDALVLRDDGAGVGPMHVGIDTNLPQATLDVNGDTLTRGALYHRTNAFTPATSIIVTNDYMLCMSASAVTINGWSGANPTNFCQGDIQFSNSAAANWNITLPAGTALYNFWGLVQTTLTVTNGKQAILHWQRANNITNVWLMPQEN